jgi:hypothetical protein
MVRPVRVRSKRRGPRGNKANWMADQITTDNDMNKNKDIM